MAGSVTWRYTVASSVTAEAERGVLHDPGQADGDSTAVPEWVLRVPMALDVGATPVEARLIVDRGRDRWADGLDQQPAPDRAV